MSPYAWKTTHQRSGKNYYYKTDLARRHTCTDEAAEAEYRQTTTIVSWEDKNDGS